MDDNLNWLWQGCVVALATVATLWAGLSQAAIRLPQTLGDRVQPTSPWSTTAGAAVAAGRSSQRAARATGDFFSRFGENLAGSF